MSRKSLITPTEEQIHCVEMSRDMQDMRIEAYAGATKTTTLKLIAQDNPAKKGLYLAFNKGVVMAAKFPSNVTAKTIHSLAYGTHGRVFKDRLDTRITGRLVADSLGLSDFSGNGQLIMSAADLGSYLLSTVENFCRDLELAIGMEHMPVPDLASMEISAQDIRLFLWNSYKSQAWKLWEKMSSPTSTFPSRHCVYMKLWALSSPIITGFDYILLDEAQDACPLMLAVMRRQRIPVFYVGDRYQQIYSWRGAVNAMSLIDTQRVAYLTKSFRFGHELASMADMLLCAMGADVTLRGNEKVDTQLVELDKPAAILCRTNANVSKWVMEAVLSGDTDFAATGTEDAIEFFASAIALKKGKPGKGKYKLFKSWGELCAYSLTGDGGDLANFVRLEREYGAEFATEALKKVADKTPEKASRVISTAHRAKGCEYSSVMLDDDFRSPLDARYQEEDSRLFYVAMTRAINVLDMTRCEEVFVDLLTHRMGTPLAQKAADVVQEVAPVTTHILSLPPMDFTLTAPVYKPSKRKAATPASRTRLKRIPSWAKKTRYGTSKRKAYAKAC
jgi:hypothetical protein